MDDSKLGRGGVDGALWVNEGGVGDDNHDGEESQDPEAQGCVLREATALWAKRRTDRRMMNHRCARIMRAIRTTLMDLAAPPEPCRPHDRSVAFIVTRRTNWYGMAWHGRAPIDKHMMSLQQRMEIVASYTVTDRGDDDENHDIRCDTHNVDDVQRTFSVRARTIRGHFSVRWSALPCMANGKEACTHGTPRCAYYWSGGSRKRIEGSGGKRWMPQRSSHMKVTRSYSSW